jgi:CheY-like chemotaxis protein
VGVSEGHATICVRDSGVGIAPDILPKIFDLFVQSKETLDRSEGGMGVGLTLVKTIVELHGGSVTVASEGSGKGSEFTVRLPLAPRPHQNSTASNPVASNGVNRRLRIAVVEDNADSRTMLKSLLALDGHEVSTAEDGLRGLELIKNNPPEVALIDIGLPGLDGFELAKRLRSCEIKPRVVLVALTGYGLPADRERALSAGFDAHLVKPLNLTDLAKILAEIGNNARNRDSLAED